jgi:hypothetical protein
MSELSGTNLNNTKMPQKDKSSGRKILLILAAIFVLPFTVAATLHLLNVHPSGHSYGSLVKPPHALQFPVLHDAQGKEFKAQQWLKKWSIVTVDSTGCAEPCQAQIHLLKQVHTSLGKEFKRIQRVLLIPGELNGEAFNDLQRQYPDLILLAGTDAETVKFSAEFNVAGNHVYLVDPLGNLMMSYPENMDPKGLRSDLTRLLKNSWAG